IRLLVRQFMFGGPLLGDLGRTGGARVIGSTTVTKWAYEGLQRITGIDDRMRVVPAGTPVSKWAGLVAIIAVLFLLILGAQKRKDWVGRGRFLRLRAGRPG